MEQTEFKAITCNYRIATKTNSLGAKAYVTGGWGGGGWERIRVVSRSRGGRWIEKWDDSRRFANFRLTTVVPEDTTIYAKLVKYYPHAIGRTDQEMQGWCDFMNRITSCS
jgi:hypothetical protein